MILVLFQVQAGKSTSCVLWQIPSPFKSILCRVLTTICKIRIYKMLLIKLGYIAGRCKVHVFYTFTFSQKLFEIFHTEFVSGFDDQILTL